MQTTFELRSAVPLVETMSVMGLNAPPESAHFPLRRVGVTLAAAGLMLGSCGEGEKVYTISDLESAPHDARIDLPANTNVVFVENEGPDCTSNKHALAPFGGMVVNLAPSTKSKPTGGPNTKSPKPVKRCGGNEAEVIVCKRGVTQGPDITKLTSGCVFVDFEANAFVTATGVEAPDEGQVIPLKTPLSGRIDRD